MKFVKNKNEAEKNICKRKAKKTINQEKGTIETKKKFTYLKTKINGFFSVSFLLSADFMAPI